MTSLALITVSVQVAFVAAIGLIAAFLLRSAAHRHNVLMAALVCMLASPLFYLAAAWSGLSVTLPAVLSATNETAKAVPAPTVTTPIRQPDAIPSASSEFPRSLPQAALETRTLDSREASIESTAIQVNDPPKFAGPTVWRADIFAGVIWLLGTLFLFVGVLRSRWKTGLVLRGARPLDRRFHADVIAEAALQLRVRGGLRIGTSGKVAGPVVVGIFQPWILIPARYLETLSRGEMLQVLIHEGAHALRRDPLMALLQRICSALFWWNPLVHLVNQQLTRAREEVCDNFVLTHIEPETYGATLLRLAMLSPAMARMSLASGMFDGRGTLEDRIRGLLDRRRKIMTRVRFATATSILIGFALFSVFVASARVGAQTPDDSASDVPSVVPKKAETQPAESVDAKIPPSSKRDVAVTFQGPPNARDDQDEATVVGTVVSPDGNPVAGIEVLAFQGGKQFEQKFMTNEQGEIRVPKAWRETDEWLTVVARDGRERLGWFDFMIHGHSDVGQKTEDGSFRLVLLPMSRTIRGRVVDERGQPLAKIPVRINQLVHDVNMTSVHWRYQKLGDEPLVLDAVTDDDGRFELKLPAKTSAWLGTAHPDWVEQLIRVTKEKDEVAESKLVRAAKVTGRVIDVRSGKPLAGVSIVAYAAKTEIFESGGGDAKTDADGNYIIRGLRGGEHTIQLLKGVSKFLTAPAHSAIVLKPGETFRADFSLSVGKRLEGRVLDIDTGEPIPSCKVTYNGPAHPSAGLSTETNQLGEFVFFVPPGPSSLNATEGRRFGNDSTRTVDVPADGNPEPVVLKVGERIEPVPGRIKIFIGLPLDRKVLLRLKDTPLAEALDDVCNRAGMKLKLDEAALTNAGYSKETPVTLYEENPVTLQEALTLVLKPFKKLSFTADKNQIVVGSFPPTGLEFLLPYPKLYGVSLDMSEKQFLEIVNKQDLQARKTSEGETVQYRIALGDDHTLIVMFRQDGTCRGIQRVRGKDAADEKVSLEDLARNFNAENQKLERGLDQPPLTEDEVVAAIQRSEWAPGDRNRTEREFAVFMSIAKSRQLPKESYFTVWTTEEPSTFVVNHLWSIQLFLPSLDGDGFDGFSIRHTKLHEEKIDPKSVAWGKPDADGLSLGAYLSPRKDKYALGERVRLRLFVRNEGKNAVKTTWANTTHPLPNDFKVTDEKGAKVAVRMDPNGNWSEKWISGFIGGELGPGAAHALHVPFELGIGGAGTNKLIGRVIDAHPGQTLQLRVLESTGNNRTRTDGEPEPESGNITFIIADR